MNDITGKTRKPRQPKAPAEATASKPSTEEVLAKRRGAQRPFPAAPFEEAMMLANDLLRVGSGQPVRRLTLFNDIGKAPESGASRMLITNANRYGLISGGYQAEHLELTPDGLKAVDDSTPSREQARVRVRLAIENVEPFAQLYDRLKGTKLPSRAVLADAVRGLSIPEKFVEEGVDTFILNLRFVGLLQTLSGAERVVTVEHLLDTVPATSRAASAQVFRAGEPDGFAAGGSRDVVTKEHADFQTTCFYITPIGVDGSDERQHSDLFLSSIVEPALQQFNLKVIRADAIDKPGMITRQVIEHILRARLVIADLSFHNPNVFYELALRHATRLPVVQIVRVGDSIPFDVGQMRTVRIDNSTIYSLVPKIETYQSEIASQVRRALESEAEIDTPISTYFPGFRVNIDGAE